MISQHYSKTSDFPFTLSESMLEWLNYKGCISEKCKKLNYDYKLQKEFEFFPDKVSSLYTRSSLGIINGKPCIDAIITADYNTYIQYKDILDNLKNSPIGKVLFFSSKFERSNFLYIVDKENDKFVVTRISRIIKNNCMFNLTESFLQELPNF